VIPLVRPTLEQDDIDSIIKTAKEKQVQQGEVAHEFEKEFAGFIGAEGGMVTNSGTAALYLALRALNIGNGDEIIVPTYTCTALLNAVIYINAIPRLIDCNFNVADMDFNLSAKEVKRKVGKRTKAIIVPHMFGVPAEMNDLSGLDIPIIEDGTLSIGAYYKSGIVGSFGEISVFSFHASKMLACGEGGMILSKSPKLLSRIRYLNGWEDEQPSLRLKHYGDIEYEERYNYRMSDLAASLGLSQLRKLPQFINRRIDIAGKYNEAFRGVKDIELPQVKQDRTNVFFRYLIELHKRDIPGVLTRFMQANIEVGRGVYPPLHYYLKEDRSLYPNAERAVNSLISIPIYPSLTEAEIQHIISTTLSILER
jgi:perosamine synthetase